MLSDVHETRPAIADRLLGFRRQVRPTWTHSLRRLIDLSTTAHSLDETIHPPRTLGVASHGGRLSFANGMDKH